MLIICLYLLQFALDFCLYVACILFVLILFCLTTLCCLASVWFGVFVILVWMFLGLLVSVWLVVTAYCWIVVVLMVLVVGLNWYLGCGLGGLCYLGLVLDRKLAGFVFWSWGMFG